ncbi:hypothetical protein LLG90_28275, partial [Aromatoleum toluclasticum]|uniref:hypothetical protein n=1 Tax=Aromatoleum toluclasticum TaxID=92003 RepID=UPI001D191A1B
LAAGNVALTATASITDGDNDTASDSETIDISGAFSFDDDTPTINVAATSATMPALTTQDADTIGTAFDTDSGSFTALFSVTPDMGA